MDSQSFSNAQSYPGKRDRVKVTLRSPSCSPIPAKRRSTADKSSPDPDRHRSKDYRRSRSDSRDRSSSPEIIRQEKKKSSKTTNEQALSVS